MTQERPYFSDSIAMLEVTVDQNDYDLEILDQVTAELKHRSTLRAKDLQERVKGLIKQEREYQNQPDVDIQKEMAAITSEDLELVPAKKDKKKMDSAARKLDDINKVKKPVQYPEGFLVESFQALRNKLLDTAGSRSRLLNLDQSKKGFVRVVDELPKALASILLAEKTMRIVSVPEPTLDELIEHGYLERDEETSKLITLKPDPTAKEWAAVKGIHSEYELPSKDTDAGDGRHTDTDVQTLLFSPHLNKNLKSLSKDAKTSIEETGNNILFLSVGFLEYTDQAELNGTARKRLAPLFMIPVSIEKKVVNSITHFFIKYTGEDIIDNLTLREKLVQEYEIYLPSVYKEDEDASLLDPEAYFEEVQALLARKSDDPNISQWRVRRFATLATLSLGKLLMYKDLDPELWPDDGAALLDHELISSFFGTAKKQGSAGLRTETHGLDKMPTLHHDFPMVEDADSSQMSALIDVLNGENLVIEGPPGTGKSQTITNLIAAALSQKKSVLFVAEKQAALDVVKRRLDKAGLGDFCLDLHSDKAQKKKVLDSFGQRIANQDAYTFSEADYSLQVNRYERARDELQTYVETVNQSWKETGLTIHQILMAATRYAKEAAPLEYEDVKPQGLNGNNFSRFFLDEQLQQLEKFYDYLERVSNQLEDKGNWESHPWFGVNNKSLAAQSESAVKTALAQWNDSLEALFVGLGGAVESFGVVLARDITLDGFDQWLDEWQALPNLQGKELFTCFKLIQENDLPEIKEVCEQIETIAQLYQRLSTTFHRAFLSDLSQARSIEESIQTLKEIGVSDHVTFESIVASVSKLEGVIQLLKALDEDRVTLRKSVNEGLAELFTPDMAGFNELACFTDLVSELPAEYISHRCDEYDDDSLDEAIVKLKEQISALNTQQTDLSSTFKLDSLPEANVLRQYAKLSSESTAFSFFKKDWRAAKKHLRLFSTIEKPAFKKEAEHLEKAAKWLEAQSALNESDYFKKTLGSEFEGVTTHIERLEVMRAWYKKVRSQYGVGFGRRVPLASGAFHCSKDVFRGVQGLGSNALVSKVNDLSEGLTQLSQTFPKEVCLRDEHYDLAQDPNPLQTVLYKVKESLGDVQKHLLNPNLPQSNLMKSLKEVDELKSKIEQVDQADLSGRFFSGTLDFTVSANGSLPEDYAKLSQSSEFLSTLYSEVNLPELRAQVNACDSEADYLKLQQLREGLDELESSEAGFCEAFLKLIDGDIDSWLQGREQVFSALVDKNSTALGNLPWLDGWLKYLYAKERLEAGGFTKLKDYLLKQDVGLEHVQNVLKFACYRTIAEEIYAAVPLLSQKSGHEQSAVQRQFAEIDEGLKKIQRNRVAALAADVSVPEGERGAKVSSYSEGALITHELGKKTRHVAIRRLVERAGRAMKAYTPCFMMSPMAVAKYIPPGSLEFDLVVMDEASQVKQEYALSCFARGKTVVVVGDPKQLPPTSFFEKATSDSDIDSNEVSVIQDSESILEAIGGFTPKRMLQWHYRSRHESLIAFSNHNFYDSRLVVFPSPWDQSDEFGIKHHFVENGRFLNSVNQTESHAVVNAIRDHLLSSKESLGVVAMNSKQRDLIEADLEAAAATDKQLADALSKNRNSSDPLFIKNLENVQGDERDVIFISFTYGPAERGASAIPQRFGPINSENGWRRLNVLFTRAKKRKHVFTSMRSGQILVSDTSSRGVQALKDYLTFVETGRLAGAGKPTGKEPDSDFEVAVIKMLEDKGYQCEPQLGVEGYFIDIAVRDPGMPGRYLMGIECDGATYHRAKSTRDRDRVRQAVLESLGWNIKRIWSTDWFKNPDAELKPIFDELAELASPIQVAKPIDDFELEMMPASGASDLFKDETHFELEQQYASKSISDETLVDRLLKFQSQVIAKEYPDTEDERRLLRPDILHRLVENEPRDRDEFVELIPQYLRSNTDTQEAFEFLDDVLEIVAEFVEA